MNEIVSRPSILCPLCNQRSTKYVCARCALTTAEERDAARAEVERLTALVGEARRLIEEHVWEYEEGEFYLTCPECKRPPGDEVVHSHGCPIAAFLAATQGAIDAAT